MVLQATARRGEHGFSLVESVIAVAVLGIIVSAMVGGMATSIATSDIHRQQSVANTVMVSAAELIKNATYVSCATAGTYSTNTVRPAAWPASAIITSVQYWNAKTSKWDPSQCHDNRTPGPEASCFGMSVPRCQPDGLGGLFPMQMVTILVTNPGHRASTSVNIIKRAP